ncbi:amphi-Trp domain-containing protein [bacterium]|nr:amphi-Trp domain-containing protein [bacterium]MCB9476184.1 amphi-Trp domain-containing protein [Deltaproteobacteria bacterium]
MATKDRKFEHESLQDRESIGRYLAALQEGFATGKIELANADDTVSLSPNGLINLQIKVVQTRTESHLTIDVGWKRPSRKKKESGALKISGGKA